MPGTQVGLKGWLTVVAVLPRATLFVAFLAGLILSADHLGGRGGPKDIASRAPVKVAVSAHLSDARCGPDEQHAASEAGRGIPMRPPERTAEWENYSKNAQSRMHCTKLGDAFAVTA